MKQDMSGPAYSPVPPGPFQVMAIGTVVSKCGLQTGFEERPFPTPFFVHGIGRSHHFSIRAKPKR